VAGVPPQLVVSMVKAAALVAAGRALPAGVVPARVVALTEGMVRTMARTKLTMTCAALVLLAGVGAGLPTAWKGAAGQPGAAAGERAKGERPAGAPKQPVHPMNKALEGLTKAYALEDHEVLRWLRPPHPKERRAFFRLLEEARSAEEKIRLKEIGLGDFEMDGNLTLVWKGGRLEFGSVVFAQPRNPPQGRGIEDLLRSLARIAPEEVEGDRDLRWKTLLDGDFVVRDGAAPAKVVSRLEEVLNKEGKLPFKLTLAEEDRKVFVLGGRYRFTPAAPGRADNHIDLYAEELRVPDLPPVGGGLGARPQAPVAEFVSALGRFLDRRAVLGKAEGLPEGVSWTDHSVGPLGGATAEQWEADHAPGPVLKHVTEQTGLTVREETRRVRVLSVERKK
jgi:hypothetical protein